MGAAYFAIPEMELEQSEARAIAEAIAEVNRHYSIPGINPAHASIASLAFVLAVTYGKRVPIIMAARKSKASNTGMAQSAPSNTSFASVPIVQPQAEAWFSPSDAVN